MRTVTSISTAHGREVSFEQLLSPGEVAVMFRVDPATVARWARAGVLSSVRTPGGHRRFFEAEVRKHLDDWQSS
jgi:excisionase family DNA binding protein